MKQIDHDGIEEMAADIARLDEHELKDSRRDHLREDWEEGRQQAARDQYRAMKESLAATSRALNACWAVFWVAMAAACYVLYLGGQFPDMLPPKVVGQEEDVLYALIGAVGVLIGFCSLFAIKVLRMRRNGHQRTLDRLAFELGRPCERFEANG